MVATTDLKVYKTTNNLGGAITATEVALATPNNLFTNVPNNERVLGEDYYACVYLKNTHATEPMDNFKLWLSTKSLPTDTEIKWARDAAGSGTAQTIADKYTSPTSISWSVLGTQESSSINFGTLSPSEACPIWLWYHVNANAISRIDDNETFTLSFDIPFGGSGSGGGGTGGGGGGGTGGNPPPTVADFKVAIIGDEGCGSITNSVISRLNSNGYNFVMSVGDHAYSSASCWTSAFSALKNAGKLNAAYGNHEYSESGGITPYKTFFGHSLTYFTFKFQNIQFFVLDTNINMDSGSAQNTFITNALTASQTDNTVVWRIVIFHHPMYGSPSDHAYNTANTRGNFHQKFQDAHVNFVYTGHNHNWQRTDQITYNSGSPGNPTVVDSSSPYSADTIGFIHIISGTSGHDSSSNLYGLGSQPSYQHYQNNSHNGFHELVASNGGLTLTCSFVDVGGAKFDTFVYEKPTTIPSPSTVDQFGITKLNATKTGGREWFSKWNNGHARTLSSSGTGIRNTDPDDVYVDFHCNSTASQGNSATIDGLGTMKMTGVAPRHYVNDQNRILKWENVEMTCYYRYLQDYPSGSIFVHQRLAGRSEHQDEYLCCASGHTAGMFESKKNGVLQLRKELIHPAYADDEISGTTGGEVNTWIGMKLVLKQESGDTRVIGYRDITDGSGGGTWVEVVNKLDAGDWAFTDGTEITSYDNCSSSGSGTCVKITPRTAKILGPANSCYLRCDSSEVEYKKFSIREINPS